VLESDPESVVYAFLTGEPGLRQAALYRSDGVEYRSVATLLTQSTVGVAENALGAANPRVIDYGNTLTVQLAHGELSSLAADTFLRTSERNLCAIETADNFLLIKYRDAEHLGGNRWRLSGLLQGYRGSEGEIGKAEAGAAVYFFDGYYLPLEGDVADVGVEQEFKAIATNQALDDAPVVKFTPVGRSLWPLSPVNVEGDRDETGNLTIQWRYRTRSNGQWRNNGDVLLSEPEKAIVRVLDGDTLLLERSVVGRNLTVNLGGVPRPVQVEVRQESPTPGIPLGYVVEAIL